MPKEGGADTSAPIPSLIYIHPARRKQLFDMKITRWVIKVCSSGEKVVSG